ncbi:MAG TPA: DoxX family protein [Flavisolibacter sp.]
MNYLQRLEYWGDHHHPKWLDLLRIALGVFLCIKGAEFASNIGAIMGLMEQRAPFSDFMIIIVAHYVLFAHLFGGFLLAVGLLTRFACLIQIPVLIGALFFINTSGFFNQFSELFMLLLVLLLLIYFWVIGSGPWSFDRLIDEERSHYRHS